MARTTTAAQDAALAALDRSTHLRVYLEDPDGTLQDMTDFHGVDWVDSVEITASQDDPISSATLTLWREVGPLSLAPLMTGSTLNRGGSPSAYAPFIQGARAVRIQIATLAGGSTPGPSDWVTLWEGTVDEPSFGGRGSRIRLTARDLMAAFNDTIILDQTLYGSDGSPSVGTEEVQQAILDDVFGAGAYTLNVVGDPDFAIRATGADGEAYGPVNVSVLEALRALGDLQGWNHHVFWVDSPGEFQATYYQPIRDAVDLSGYAPNHTIGPDDYYDVTELSQPLKGVRNKGILYYADANGEQQKITDTRSASVALYGERAMVLDVTKNGSIQDSASATALLSAALDDTEAPDAIQEIEAAFWWPLELNDMVRFGANGVHYDTDQDWAVYGYTHTLSAERKRTTIRSRGQPSGGWRRWIKTAVPVPREPEILRVYTVSQTETQAVKGWQVNGAVYEVWVYQATEAQGTTDPLTVSSDGTIVDKNGAAVTPTQIRVSSATQVTIPLPATNSVTYVLAEPRDSDLNPGELWSFEVHPLDPAPPIVEVDDTETADTGTLYVKVTEQGLTVSSVQFQTQVGLATPSSFGSATRTAGATSVVKTGTLGADEYEMDVALAFDRLSWILCKITLSNGEVITSGPHVFDRGRVPTIVDLRVSGQEVTGISDTDCESMKLEHVDGSWSAEIDQRRYTWDVSQADASANAGIGAGETWTMRLTVRSDPTSEVDANTLTNTEDVIVNGSGGGAGEPTWDAVSCSPPSNGSADATVTLDADTAPSGYAARVWARYDDYSGWTAFSDITASLSPALTAPPTSSTAYTYTTPHTRVTGGLSLVRYEFRCEIIDGGSNVVATSTVATSWYVGSP